MLLPRKTKKGKRARRKRKKKQRLHNDGWDGKNP
jgi:hypothetical protein